MFYICQTYDPFDQNRNILIGFFVFNKFYRISCSCSDLLIGVFYTWRTCGLEICWVKIFIYHHRKLFIHKIVTRITINGFLFTCCVMEMTCWLSKCYLISVWSGKVIGTGTEIDFLDEFLKGFVVFRVYFRKKFKLCKIWGCWIIHWNVGANL